MIHVSTFTGIGGFEIAAGQMGWETPVMCEVNPFCRHVLRYHFPDAYIHSDVFTLTGEIIRREINNRYGKGKWNANDIVFTAGFPCQPFSLAGNRRGSADNRYLFPQVERLIRELRPGVILLENVPGLVSILQPAGADEVETKETYIPGPGNGNERLRKEEYWLRARTMGVILQQIQEAGYSLPQTSSGIPVVLCVPAGAYNAPHRRQRVAVVAYRNSHAQQEEIERTRQEHFGERGNIRGDAVPVGLGGLFADADNAGKRTPGCMDNAQRQARGDREGRCLHHEPCRPGGPRDASHAKGGNDRRNPGEQEERQEQQPGNIPVQGTSPYAHGLGRRQVNELGWKSICGPADSRQGRESAGTHAAAWRDFPTESPVYAGNDGLPNRLAGYSVSGWRQEFDRAIGNAVVPVWAYSLFRAIQASRDKN